MPLAPHERPFVDRRYHTEELPDTPQRDYRIPASGWVEAPDELLTLGDELGEPVEYKRRIGRYLLWRAGPPVGEARYLAAADLNGAVVRMGQARGIATPANDAVASLVRAREA